MKLLTLVVLGLSFVALCQEVATRRLQGEVLKASDHMPIPYAHLRVEGGSAGIHANSEGKFVLTLDGAKAHARLVFSAIGYKSTIVSVQDVLENSTVLLHDTVIVLPEVVVAIPEPRSIMRRTIQRYDANYAKDPFHLKGFYRTAYKENNRYVRLLEASVIIADRGFRTSRGYRAHVAQSRQSHDYRQFKWQQAGNFLVDYLKKDNIRNRRFFLDKKLMDAYDYYLEGLTELDGEALYHLHVELKDTTYVRYAAEVYVRIADHALIQLSDTTVLKHPRKYSVAEDLHLAFTGGATHAYYTDVDGACYLSYSDARSSHEAFDAGGKLKGTLVLEEELLVLGVGMGKFEGSESIGRQGDIYTARYPHDPQFWDDFDLPVETARFRQIKADLNTREPLQEQFRQNGSPRHSP